jgi:hypothetical protein
LFGGAAAEVVDGFVELRGEALEDFGICGGDIGAFAGVVGELVNLKGKIELQEGTE